MEEELPGLPREFYRTLCRVEENLEVLTPKELDRLLGKGNFRGAQVRGLVKEQRGVVVTTDYGYFKYSICNRPDDTNNYLSAEAADSD